LNTRNERTMKTYLQSIDKKTSNEILRLTKRLQGLTIEAFEVYDGQEHNAERVTFTDAEQAAEMYFRRFQDVFGVMTFDY